MATNNNNNNNKQRLPSTIFVKLNKAHLYKDPEPNKNAVLKGKSKSATTSSNSKAKDTPNDVREVDLIVFDDDDDINNNNNSNKNHNINIVAPSQQNPAMDLIDLLCDLNFGLDTASSNDDSSSISMQDTIEKTSQNIFPPKLEPYRNEPPRHNYNNEVRTPENYQNHQSRHQSLYHAKAESSNMQTKRRQLVKSPKSPKRVYSFTELIIYRFSPLAKNIKCSFSSDAVEYNLLLVENSNDNSPNRQPGICRSGPIPRNNNNNNNNKNNNASRGLRNEFISAPTESTTLHNEQPPLTTSRNNDYNSQRNKYYNEEKKLYIVPALRKQNELSPLDLSWINEFIEAQNRWIALLMGRSLAKKAKNQLIDCKDFKNLITTHFNSKENHDDKCVSKPIVENILLGKECTS